MYSDFHVHSDLSFDSNEPAENQVKRAIELNMEKICFTEHHDIGWFFEGNTSSIDMDKYNETISSLRAKYSDQIEILQGIEIGITKENIEEAKAFVEDQDFDFVIGSFHELNGEDPYYPGFWDGKSEAEIIDDYFNVTYELLKDFVHVDTLAHLDYIVRYCPSRDANYNPMVDQKEVIDNILNLLIERDICLEINTSNRAKGFDFAHPHPDILKRYVELGGKKVTVGSDAHQADKLGYAFDEIKELIDELGLQVIEK